MCRRKVSRSGGAAAGPGMNKTDLRLVLVDDEPLARARLKRMLAGLEGIELCGEAGEGRQALELIRETRPDAVLLDVEMPGTDGVSAAAAINELAPPPAVIFITAYESYALDAFGVRALDYLVKPVRASRLDEALARVREVRPVTTRKALSARVGERLQRIPLETVRVLRATDKYTQVAHTGGVHLVDESLVALESEFPDRFVRVHRATLVSREHITGLFRDSDGTERLQIADCKLAPKISRRNLSTVRKVLKD